MSIAMDIFFCRSIGDDFSTVLSVSTSVGGCGWTIYDRVILVDVALWQFSNNLPNSFSIADTTTLLIMINSTCTGTFYRGVACTSVLDFGPRKKYPHALLCAYCSDM